MKVTVPAGMGPGSTLVVQVRADSAAGRLGGAPVSSVSSSGGELDEAALSGAANLLEEEEMDGLHSDAVWAERLQKLSTTGAACSKVARTGKPQKRTFWLKKGQLHTN